MVRYPRRMVMAGSKNGVNLQVLNPPRTRWTLSVWEKEEVGIISGRRKLNLEDDNTYASEEDNDDEDDEDDDEMTMTMTRMRMKMKMKMMRNTRR
jgi:hypothetical protein